MPALESMPELDLKYEIYWTAFSDLAQTRGSGGFAPQPILTSDVLAWLELHDVRDLESRRDIYEIVLYLDRELRKLFEERNRADDASGDRRKQGESRS